jgi:carbonyl reductase 1
MTKFVESAKDGTYAEKGYKSSTYAMSKVGLSALTRIQQQEFNKHPDSDLIINHVHPGYVDTDMTSHKGPRTIDEGAESSIQAALLDPLTECKGKLLWSDCAEKDWAIHEWTLATI